MSKVSDYLGESFTAWFAASLTTLASVSIGQDWIDVGTRIMRFVNMTALAAMSVLILANWIYCKFIKKKK